MGKHPNGVTALAFHPGGDILLSGGRDGILAVWRWRRGRMVGAKVCGGEVSNVEFDRGGEMVGIAVGTATGLLFPITQYLG
jgi:WD40 repeat protein